MENKEKKKHPILKTIGIVFAVLFILGIIGSFIPDTDTSGQTVAKTGTVGDASANNESTDVKEETKVEETIKKEQLEEKVEDSIDESQEESTETIPIKEVVDDSKERNQEYYDKYYMLGDPISCNGGTVFMTITEVGFKTNQFGDRLVYMVVDIDNQSGDTISMHNQDFSLYIDGYQYRNEMVYLDENDNGLIDITVNPGRKGIITYRSALPDEYSTDEAIDNIETLEIQIGNGTIIYVKDHYQYMYAG